jgi:hemolysin III
MDWFIVREPTSAWTHFAWMLLAIPGTILLLWLSRRRPVTQFSMLVFGLSTMFCMLGSFLFHAAPASMVAPFDELDHIGIYVMIAGTVTPIAILGLRGRWRRGLLVVIWALAAIGITIRLMAQPPLAVRTAFYLIMGWIGIVTYFQLAQRLSHRTVSLIWIGGLLYTIGAVINVRNWPTLNAHWFDAHALFHVFVMAGNLAHFTFMVIVLMHQREPRANFAAANPITFRNRKKPAAAPQLPQNV